MIEKVKELRQILPIPMGEALQLLKLNAGDIEKSTEQFKANSIRQICELTGCSETMASEHYTVEKYDFNRTISSVKEAIYDLNYKPIEGVTQDTVRAILQWVYMIEGKDFSFSLDHLHFDSVIKTIALLPNLQEIVPILDKAKAAKMSIFEGYTDANPLEDFVRRHKLLDDHPDFRQADAVIPLKVTVIKDELIKHLRNLAKE